MAKWLWAAPVLCVQLAAPTMGQVVGATVEVSGMACPFCAFGVEKRLRKVEGVSSIEVVMAEGRAILSARDGASIDPAGIPEAIRKAGFTPGRVEVEIVGVPQRQGPQSLPRWALTAEGQEMLLVDVRADLAEQLAELARRGAAARVRAVLRLPVGEHPEFEPLEVQARQ